MDEIRLSSQQTNLRALDRNASLDETYTRDSALLDASRLRQTCIKIKKMCFFVAMKCCLKTKPKLKLFKSINQWPALVEFFF